MKARTPRKEVLRLVEERGTLSPHDLVNSFNYTLWSAYWKLHDLKERGLVINVETGLWSLSEKGKRELSAKGGDEKNAKGDNARYR